jgi:hypothetical protein
LRYITYVAGRPRSAIVPEMESVLALPLSPDPIPDDYKTDQPALDSQDAKCLIRDPESDEWRSECERAMAAVWTIGRARLRGMGMV